MSAIKVLYTGTGSTTIQIGDTSSTIKIKSGTVQDSSGTFAWLSDITSLTGGYIPYTGATANVDLGSHFIKAESYYINSNKMLHHGTDAANQFNLYSGYNAGSVDSYDSRNVGIGYNALRIANGSLYSVGIGGGALANLVIGDNNTATGRDAGFNLNGGDFNALYGSEAGYSITSGSRNTFVNYVNGVTAGSYNTAVGFSIDFSGATNSQASIALGAYTRPTGNQQFVVGSSDAGFNIKDVYFGSGVANPDANLWIGSVTAKGSIGINGGIDPLYSLTIGSKPTGALRLYNSSFTNMLTVTDAGLYNFSSSTRIGIGGAQSNVNLFVEAFSSLSTDYGLYIASQGSSSTILSVRNDGYVGIGTNTPTAALTITSTSSLISDYVLKVKAQNGSIDALVVTAESEVSVGSTAQPNIVTGGYNNIFQTNHSSYLFQHNTNLLSFGNSTVKQIVGVIAATYSAIGNYSNHDLRIRVNNTDYLNINTNGYVGIGTTTPTSKLDIKGTDDLVSTTSFKLDNASGQTVFDLRNTGALVGGTSYTADNAYLLGSVGGSAFIGGSSIYVGNQSKNSNTNFIITAANYPRIQFDSIYTVNTAIEQNAGGYGLSIFPTTPNANYLQINPNSIGINLPYGLGLRANTTFDIRSASYSATSYAINVEDSLSNKLFVIRDDGYIGIGTASPSNKLHIYDNGGLGAFRLEDGTQQSGRVLRSDANGVGTWADIGPSLCEFYNDGSSIGTTLTTLYTTSGVINTSNLLAKNGDRFKGVFGGYFTGATASTKTVQLYYGGNPLFGSIARAYESPSYWRIEFCIIRSNSSQIRYDATFTIFDVVNDTSRTEQIAGAYGGFNFTIDETIDLMGQSVGAGSANGDIISRVGHIDYVISR